MALSIKNEEADQLARELAALTGESLTQCVVISLRERIERKRMETDQRPLREQVMEIVERFNQLPVLDDRSPDEILGYDENGLPT